MPTKYGPWKINEGKEPEWSEGVTHFQYVLKDHRIADRENGRTFPISICLYWDFDLGSATIFAYREVLPPEERYVISNTWSSSKDEYTMTTIYPSLEKAKEAYKEFRHPANIYRLVPVED